MPRDPAARVPASPRLQPRVRSPRPQPRACSPIEMSSSKSSREPARNRRPIKITKRHAPYTPLMCTVRAACNQVAQAVAFARTVAAPAWTSKFALAALQNRVRAKQFVAQHFCSPERSRLNSRSRMEPRPPNAARCDPSARPSRTTPSRHAERRPRASLAHPRAMPSGALAPPSHPLAPCRAAPLPSLAYPRAIKTNPYGYTLHDALFPLRRIGHRAAAPTGSQSPCTLWAALGLRAQEHTDRRPHGQTQGRARLRART